MDLSRYGGASGVECLSGAGVCGAELREGWWGEPMAGGAGGHRVWIVSTSLKTNTEARPMMPQVTPQLAARNLRAVAGSAP